MADLEELRAFLAVVDAGSFVAAADALGTARTTLRRRVDALEARAGVKLIESTPAGVVVTEAGRALADRGHAVLAEASAVIASVRELGREPQGVLRVALPVGIAPPLLGGLFAALRAQWPRLRVHLHTADDPLRLPVSDVDLVVHFNEGRPRGPWRSFALTTIEERLVAAPAYLARRGTPRSLDELAGHELIAWHAPGEDPGQWPLRGGARFAVEPALVTSDLHVIHQVCRAGLGIGLVPDARLADPSAAGELVGVLEDVVGRTRTLRVTVPEALADVPKLRLVVDRVRAFAAQALGGAAPPARARRRGAT